MSAPLCFWIHLSQPGIEHLLGVVSRTSPKCNKQAGETQLFDIWQTELQHRVADYVFVTATDQNSIQCKAANQQSTVNSLTTVGYLLGVFFRPWIPFLVCISTSAWSQHWKLGLKLLWHNLLGFMTLTTPTH